MSYDFYSVNGEKILIKLSIDIGDILTLFKVYKPSFILEKPYSVVTAALIPSWASKLTVVSSYLPAG